MTGFGARRARNPAVWAHHASEYRPWQVLWRPSRRAVLIGAGTITAGGVTAIAEPTAGGARLIGSHSNIVSSVAFAPNGRAAVSGSYDKTLRLWDTTAGDLIRTFVGHTDIVTSLAISPDGRTVLSGSRDATLRLWDFASGQTLRVLTGHTITITSVAIARTVVRHYLPVAMRR